MTWWEKLFVGFKSKQVIEDSLKDPEIIKEGKFLEILRSKGFHYSEWDNHWERTWVVATDDGLSEVDNGFTGAEISKEVYKKVNGKWKVIMYGGNRNVFFENPVDSDLMVKEYDRFYHTKALELNILEDLRRKYGNDLEGYKFDT